MGFHDWKEGLILISGAFIWIGTFCFLVAFFGSRMINDMGNFPSKIADIQKRGVWIFAVEISFFLVTLVVYRLLV